MAKRSTRTSAAAPRPGRYEIPADAAAPARIREPSADWSATTVVSATEAARNFSDLVNRASYQGETFVIERGGRPLCRLGPLEGRRCTGADLLALLSRLPQPDAGFLDAVDEITRNQQPVSGSPWDS